VRAAYDRVPQHAQMRFVFLHHPSVLTSVVQGMVNLVMVGDTARFFPADQFDRAVAWLLDSR
jgi:hypothetical protein